MQACDSHNTTKLAIVNINITHNNNVSTHIYVMCGSFGHIIGASLSEPHTSRSQCERRTCVACTKIYFTNTESPTLGGHHTSVSCTKILDKKMESPHLGVYTGVKCSNTVQTRRARTRGEVWRRVTARTEKNEKQGL